MATAQQLTLQQNLAIRLLRVLRYNKTRIERALALLPESKRPLFHVLPFLLHINHPKFPGYVPDPDTPFGLNNYSYRDQISSALKAIFPENLALLENVKQIWPKQRKIDALVLMGSIGTIGQSTDSDFDYWLCIDGSQYREEELALLADKVTLIERWAHKYHGMEVHFFISEIDRVRRNDFGVAEGESSGSAQAIFLKAEFYTTNIVVAGKAPFWWLVPEKTSDKQYAELIDRLKAGEHPDPNWFMDLGNLEKLDSRELFGAAIWQLSKGMDSAFKSVLKMAKLEVFLQHIEQKQPLCNLLKKMVHNGTQAPGQVEHIDPYALMFDELIEHYSQTGNQDVVQLLQLCLYIKCACPLSQPSRSDEINFKRQIMADYVKRWGWSREKLQKVDDMRNWNFSELSELSRHLHSFLILSYRRMSIRLKGEEQSVSREDMTVLGRRLDAYYSKKPHKVSYLRSAFDDELYCPIVTIKAERDARSQRTWHMYGGDQTKKLNATLDKMLMKSSGNAVELFIWAVSNRLIDSQTHVLLDYQTEPLVDEGVQALIRQLEHAFPPVKISKLARTDLLNSSRVLNCLAVVNFEASQLRAEIDTLDIIYSTSWGEIYTHQGFEALDKLWMDLLDVTPQPSLHLLTPDTSHKKRLQRSFLERAGMPFDPL